MGGYAAGGRRSHEGHPCTEGLSAQSGGHHQRRHDLRKTRLLSKLFPRSNKIADTKEKSLVPVRQSLMGYGDRCIEYEEATFFGPQWISFPRNGTEE